MVIYHPPTRKPGALRGELEQIIGLLEEDRHIIWIGPNGDPGSDEIIYTAKRAAELYGLTYYDNVPREQYLALMKHAERIIGNSSSIFKEAPTLREGTEGLIHIGLRNKGREYLVARKGGSDRIVQHIKDYLEISE